MSYKIDSNSAILKSGKKGADGAIDEASLASETIPSGKLLEFLSETVFSTSVSFLILMARLSCF